VSGAARANVLILVQVREHLGVASSGESMPASLEIATQLTTLVDEGRHVLEESVVGTPLGWR
jgi:hypothetical protein